MSAVARIAAFAVLVTPILGSSVMRTTTIASPSPIDKKGPVTLEVLCRGSDLIVLGTVERLEVVHHAATPGDANWNPLPEEVPIAQVRVSKVFKGPAGVECVLFVTARRWACDSTEAQEGETVFLFLEDSSDDSQIDQDFRRSVSNSLPPGELMSVVHDGDGRMPVHGSDVAWTAEWDRKTPWVKIHDPLCPRPMHCVPLLWVSDRIADECQTQAKVWLRASVSGAQGGAFDWELELSRARQGRLVVHGAGGDRTKDLRVKSTILRRLESAVTEVVAGPTGPAIGRGSDRLGERSLEVHWAGGTMSIRIAALDPGWMRDPDHLAAARPALTIWQDLRGVFDDPACADHRPSDAEWIDQKR